MRAKNISYADSIKLKMLFGFKTFVFYMNFVKTPISVLITVLI